MDSTNRATIGLGQAARHKFGIDFFNLISSSSLPSVDISDIDVMSGIVYAGEDNAFSNGAWEPLVSFLHRLPMRTSTQRAGGGEPRLSRSKEADAELLRRHPWLAGVLDGKHGGLGASSGRAGSTTLPTNDDTDPDADSCSEVDVEDALAELRHKREAWGLTGTGEEGPSPFQVTLLGGKWLAETKGIAYDAFRGAVRANSEADHWCRTYSMQRSSRYDIGRFGERGANLCAQAWCSAMEHYFRLWEAAQPNEAFESSAADVASWRPSDDFLAWAETCLVIGQKRVQDIIMLGHGLARK